MVPCVSNFECIVGAVPPVNYPAVSAEPGKVRQSESQTVQSVWAFFLSWTLWTSRVWRERRNIWGEKEGKVGRTWVVPVGNRGWWGQWWISGVNVLTLTPRLCGSYTLRQCLYSRSAFIHELVSDLTNQRWIFSSHLFLLSLLMLYISGFGVSSSKFILVPCFFLNWNN